MAKEWMPEKLKRHTRYPMREQCTTDCPACTFDEGCHDTARNIVEWGTKECKEHNPKGVYRFECPDCMAQLKKEIGL